MHLLNCSIALFCSLFFSASLLAQTSDRGQLEKEFFALRTELAEKISAKEKEFLGVTESEKEKYAEFLQQPNTGLIRILPHEKFNEKLNTRGGGAYYSFTRLTHSYDYGSDISFEQGSLSVVFAGANFGFLRSLGNMSLDELTLDHTEIHYLANFVPPTKLVEARKYQRQSMKGIQVGEAMYRGSLEAKPQTTYVLRSINYDATDVLVAFHVIKKDEDGSLLIRWKKLKTFEIPKLERTPDPESSQQK